jgi:bifunctional non-homologous end joining protein LigD
MPAPPPDLAAAPPSWIRAQSAIVDGEVVALDEEGNPSFKLLQARAGPLRGRPEQAAPIVYYVFDLLYHDGRSLLNVPLEQRKRLLRSVLREHPVVRYSSHIEGEGEAFLEVVKQRQLEGMVAKLRSSVYEPDRRSRYWLKIKVRREQEVVVVGYEPGQRAAKELGALLVALNEDGKLRYVGEVGSGFDQRARTFWRTELDKHRLDQPPVVGAPRVKASWSEPDWSSRRFTDWRPGLSSPTAYKGADVGRDPVASRASPPSRPPGQWLPPSSWRLVAPPPRGRRQVGCRPQAPTDDELAALDAMTRTGLCRSAAGRSACPISTRFCFPSPASPSAT